jgi:hypothetical protein
MPVTIEQIDGFARFAKGLIRREHPAFSLEECLRQWREEQEVKEVVAEVRRAEVAIAAGRVVTLEEADRQIRAELGWAASEP